MKLFCRYLTSVNLGLMCGARLTDKIVAPSTKAELFSTCSTPLSQEEIDCGSSEIRNLKTGLYMQSTCLSAAQICETRFVITRRGGRISRPSLKGCRIADLCKADAVSPTMP